MFDEIITKLEHVPPKMLKRLLSGIIWEGTPESGAMAVTFDDGPDPDVTPAVLDACDKGGIRGTFFMLGENAARNPVIAKETAGRGHCIGNHSMTHRKLFLVKRQDVEDEIDAAQEIISDTTGVAPKWFRPPYGIFDYTCANVVRKRGLSMVLWTVLSGDYSDDSPERIMKTVKPFIRPGSIVVFHDTLQGGGAALPDLIREIAELAQHRNIRLTGIDELSVSPDIALDKSEDE